MVCAPKLHETTTKASAAAMSCVSGAWRENSRGRLRRWRRRLKGESTFSFLASKTLMAWHVFVFFLSFFLSFCFFFCWQQLRRRALSSVLRFWVACLQWESSTEWTKWSEECPSRNHDDSTEAVRGREWCFHPELQSVAAQSLDCCACWLRQTEDITDIPCNLCQLLLMCCLSEPSWTCGSSSDLAQIPQKCTVNI